jgi:hypothetical protein
MKGTREHTTASHRGPRHGGDGRRSRQCTSPVAAPAPAPAAIIAAPAPATAVGATGSLLPVYEDASEYTGGRLTFHGGSFLGGATGNKKKGNPTPDPPVPFDDPYICPDDLFFSDALLPRNQRTEKFYDAIEEQNLGQVIPPASNEQDPPESPIADADEGLYESDDDDDEEEPPGRCPNCRNYG